jgi:hypothetical protein
VQKEMSLIGGEVPPDRVVRVPGRRPVQRARGGTDPSSLRDMTVLLETIAFV